ncbi:MAG: AAA family ATPase [Clostridia bacterium]|nr:ATP-binding protein [Clostridium sp.]MEE0269620.1 ATP-binding protein [Clostridia bacterium]
MLIRFSFKNFKSFKNENCLDMEATSLKEHEYNVAKTENGEYLKVSAIYGANASGKTNVLQAFDYMKKRILVSDDSKKNSPIDEENIYSFMINNDPIALEVEILAKNNKIYKYGFEVLKDTIISEWLFEKRVNKFYAIFERENNNVSMKPNKISGLVNIDEKTLFLNIYSKIDRNNEDFSNVYDWFVNSMYLDLGNPNFERFINNRVSLKILSDENYKKELLKFIKTFDSGIEGIRTTPDSIEAVKNNNGIIDIEVLHRGENGEIKALPFYLESNGTRKMFHLFDFFMDALKNGMVLFVDELDAKLHPLLTRYIINLFHNSQTNIGNGQLIYSTHDTVNLNKETFRRDEIWFAEKDKDGISEIYALSDYILEDDKNAGKKVRNDATYNKDYLTGRYGAIPVLEEFNIIHEE